MRKRWKEYQRRRLLEEKKQMQRLHPGEDPLVHIREEKKKRRKTFILCSASFLLLAGGLLAADFSDSGVTTITRPAYGTVQREEEMTLKRADGTKENVSLSIAPRQLTEEEGIELLEEAYDELVTLLPGENEDLSHISRKLVFCDSNEAGTVQAEWLSLTPELIDSFGEIVKPVDEISETGENGSILLTLRTGTYETEQEIAVTVFPGQIGDNERIRLAAQKALDENAMEEEARLPDEIEGEKITWYRSGKSFSWGYLAAGFPLMLLLILEVYEQRRKDALKDRLRQMERDYSGVLSEFTVLTQAGMNPRTAWERMIKQYESCKKRGGETRYIYEEMKITWNQISTGCPEGRSYIEFGKRTQLQIYRRFGSFLEQNMRQGTRKLSELLMEEVHEAFELRTRVAKQAGEEAESKLLIPMLLNLCVVFLIVLVPAFLNF